MTEKKDNERTKKEMVTEEVVLPDNSKFRISGHMVKKDGTSRNIETKERPDFLLSGSKSKVKLSNPYGISYKGHAANQIIPEIERKLTKFECDILDILGQTDLSVSERVNVTEILSSVIQEISESKEVKQQLLEAPLRWSDRNKSVDQKPHEFIQEIYFDAGYQIDRTTLRKLDRSLLTQLEAQERDSERAPPQDFLERFPRKRTQLDAEVARVKETGERPSSWREQHRLRQAARRRGTDLNKP